MNDLREVIKHINPSILDYSQWISVGMILKSEGYSVDDWDSWSRDDSRYKEGECRSKWETFNGSSNPLTKGTLIQMAKEQGYQVKAYSGNGCLDWDDVIEYEGEESKPLRRVADQLIKYLEVLFEPSEFVGIITNDAFQDAEGKWRPRRGVFHQTQRELIERLKKHPYDLGASVGDWKPEAGAWIRINPLDGKGAKKENVTKYRFVLVECDDIPIEEQRKAYEKLNLPIAALVFSGGKSLHAIVHIDAKDREEYRDRVTFLFDYLKSKNLSFDMQNKDENRMSRLPGATRNGVEQTLLAVNIGAIDYDDWIETLKGEELVEDSISEMLKNPPPLAPELLSGLLRRGHKMLLSGASKSGKSFALIELSICLSEGIPFLGFECKRKNKVVYINFEIDRASSIKRFQDVYKALNIKLTNDIATLNLRGKAKPLKELVPTLVRKYKGKGIDVFIIDPIYKVITGDENNASEMAEFCNQFDILCDQLNATVIYAHHHSKGAQGGKTAQDRSSGSGVFSRDPDAIIDLTQLEIDDDFRLKYLDNDSCETAWEIECIAREFRKPRNRKCWFRYPLHVLGGDELNELYTKGSMNNARKMSPNYSTKEQRQSNLEDWYSMLSVPKDGNSRDKVEVSVQTMSEYSGKSLKTIRRYIQESSVFKVVNNVIRKVENEQKTI